MGEEVCNKSNKKRKERKKKKEKLTDDPHFAAELRSNNQEAEADQLPMIGKHITHTHTRCCCCCCCSTCFKLSRQCGCAASSSPHCQRASQGRQSASPRHQDSSLHRCKLPIHIGLHIYKHW